MEVKERPQKRDNKEAKASERESLIDKVSLSSERGQCVLLSREDTEWKWCFNAIIWWQVQGQETNKLASETAQE